MHGMTVAQIVPGVAVDAGLTELSATEV